jgi:hypothetical protein
MRGLGERLSSDVDLLTQRVAVRVVTDQVPTAPWEVTGSGAVKLREDATYGQVKVSAPCSLPGSG